MREKISKLLSFYATLIIVTMGGFLIPLNSTMIIVGLSHITDFFRISVSWSTWILTLYLVSNAVLQPVAGKMGDNLGLKRVFLWGLTIFGLASLFAGFSKGFSSLIFFRIIQSIGGSFIFPAGSAMLRLHYPEHIRGKIFGLYGALLGVAVSIGPPLGGIILSLHNWQGLFLINVPLVFATLIIGVKVLPSFKEEGRTKEQFDWKGAIFITFGLLCLVFSLTLFKDLSGEFFTLIGASTLVFFSLFIFFEKKNNNPLIDLTLFRKKAFSASVLTVFLNNMAMYSTVILLPLFLQRIQGRSPSFAGIIITTMALLMTVTSPLGGMLSDRLGRRWPAFGGMILFSIGTLLLIPISPQTSTLHIIVAMVLDGLGLGLAGPSIQTSALEASPREKTGMASGVFSTMRYLGSITGASLIGLILSGAKGDPHSLTISALHNSFIGLTVISVLSIIATWGLAGKYSHLMDSRGQGI